MGPFHFYLNFISLCGWGDVIETIFYGYLPCALTGQRQRLWQWLNQSHHIHETSSWPCRRPILSGLKSTLDCQLKPICEGLSSNLECAKLWDPAWVIQCPNNRQRFSSPRSLRMSVCVAGRQASGGRHIHVKCYEDYSSLILWKSPQGRQHRDNAVM